MPNKAIITLAVSILLGTPALASDPEYIMDTSGLGKSHNGVISSDQFLELGECGADALRLEGENALRQGHIDRALTTLQRSVEMAPTDIDGRILYATALEQKLIAQKPRDPGLFNFTVKQWLYVCKKSEFFDQSMQGRQHLLNLTGMAPTRFEREGAYLAKVMLPEDGSAKVVLGKKHDGDAAEKLSSKKDKDPIE